MNVDVARLRSLADFQNQLETTLARTAPTLCWFATQVEENRGVPRNIWRQLDRPMPAGSSTLGPAFDVWHAVLRAEKALRTAHPAVAKTLAEVAEPLKRKLEEFTSELHPTKTRLIPRLAADDIYGTFNGLTAASILRSEVFPSRSASTPSYLAGFILFAELKMSALQARAHSSRGIGDRSPRLAIASQCIHSAMLYVEHLNARALLFDKIAEECERLWTVEKSLRSLKRVPSKRRQEIADASVRPAMARLLLLSEECASLVLGSRPFFLQLARELRRNVSSASLQSVETFDQAFRNAAKHLGAVPADATQHPQHLVFMFSARVAFRLWRNVDRIKDLLKRVFEAKGYVDLANTLERLRIDLKHLAKRHVDHPERQRSSPSITDAARYQILLALIRCFADEHDRVIDTPPPDLRERLTRFAADYAVPCPPMGVVDTWACEMVQAVGDAPVGRNLSEWWNAHAQAYRCPDPRKERLDDRQDWLSLRHTSFLAVHRLTLGLTRSKSTDTIAALFRDAAATTRSVGGDVEALLKRTTQWCQGRGQQLLLTGRSDSVAVDPHEVACGLWAADRLNEPWPEPLEMEAFNILNKLQTFGGGFLSFEPVCHSRGFLYSLPSASTIAVVARYVSHREATPSSRRLQQRLHVWMPMLLKSAEFLLSNVVGLNDQGFAGWHSDRHHEPDRIDRIATTEAVTALCRINDALKSLINIEALADFGVDWPQRSISRSIPIDAGQRERQLTIRMVEMVGAQRRRIARYDSPALSAFNYAKTDRVVLFHGPPGTGKTTFQQVVASELNWPLVTITIGTFLTKGETMVAARAAEVFERLSLLSDACVIFDEFDQMIARRDPESGSRSSLSLLTPTMLPLLAELSARAARQNCLFALTTNYIEEIDSAARRGGRVDDVVVITYPDQDSRIAEWLCGHKWSARSGWTELSQLVHETSACTLRDALDHAAELASGVASRPTVAAREFGPRRPIDASYYYDRLNRNGSVDPELQIEVRRFFESVGADLLQNDEWRRLHSQFVKPAKGAPRSRVVTARKSVATRKKRLSPARDGMRKTRRSTRKP